ncbi:MAG: hypothetical protein ACR2O3_12655 [Rhizobiaceae bacterium]
MNREKLISSKFVRVLVFLWMIVFPIVFIALPALEMFTGESDKSWTPVWALIVWMLGPWVVSIVMKYAGNTESSNDA